MAEPFDPIAYRNRLLTASQRNDRPYFPPPQPVVPEPTTIGQEFFGAAKRALSGIPSGIGQVAADLPVFDQNNALQRYGQGVVERNPTDIQGLGDIVDRPGAAIAAAAGSGVGSMAGMAGARLAGMGITAVSPLFGPAAPVVAGIGQAVANVGPLASLILPAYSSVRGRQIANDPAAAESLGSKLIAAPASVLIGAVERLGGGERILEDVTKGGLAALGTGSFWRNVGRLTARGARGEALEEAVQSPIEQVAAGENPLKPANLQETAFQSAMGALGGGAIGGTFGAFAQRPKPDANTLSNDDLGKAVDDALANATTPGPSTPGPQQMDFGFPVNQGPQQDMLAPSGQPAFAPEQTAETPQRRATDIAPELGPQQDFGFLPDSGPQGQLDLRAPSAPFSGVGEQQNLPLPEPPAPIISTVPKDLLKGVPSRVVQALSQTSDPAMFLQRLQNLYRAEITAAEARRSSPKWLFGEDGTGGRLNALFATLTGGQDIEQPMLASAQQAVPSAVQEAQAPQPVPEIIFSPSGRVFTSPKQARASAAARGLAATYEPVEVGPKQFGLQRKPDVAPQEPVASSGRRTNTAARQAAEAEGKAPAVSDRRTDTATRQRVDQMTPDEMKRALLTDDLTGLPNRRAYDEAPRRKHHASIDVDSLKYINDNFGHEAGDALLKHVADALKASGAEAYRRSGDEFIAQGDHPKRLATALDKARASLGDVTLEYTAPDGTVHTYNGPGFSYGIGTDEATAEEGLKADKSAREAAGTRAARGEKPQGVAAKPAEGRQVQGGEEGQVVPQPEPDTRWLSAREQTLRDDLLIKEMTTGLTEDENALLQRLESKARGESGPQFSRSGAKATIDVDGVQRPTTNSEGRPIHPTEDGVRNFWRWFGDSKVVDGQGRPLVVYHGTTSDFQAFDIGRIRPQDYDAPVNGFWFSSDSDTSPAMENATHVMSVYLAVQNPATPPVVKQVARELAADMRDGKDLLHGVRSTHDAVRIKLQSMGYDGVLWQAPPKVTPAQAAEFSRSGQVSLQRHRGGWITLKEAEPGNINLYAGDFVGRNNHITGGWSTLDEFLEGESEQVWITFRPEQIKSAIGNQGTFDPNNPGINRSSTQGTTSTVQSVVQAISDFIGQQAFRKLGDRFVVVRDWQQVQEDMVRRGSKYASQVDETVTGLYDPSTQTSYVVASRAGDNPVGVFLHEVGAHYGLARMLGKDSHSTVLQGVVRMLRQGDSAVRAAAEQVNEHENLGLDPQSEQFVKEFSNRLVGNNKLKQELLAYLVENPANHQMSLVQRLFAGVKAFLVRMGWRQTLDTGTLVSLVTAAARKSGDFERQTVTPPQVSNDPQYNDAVDALRQFGYEPRTVNGARRIVDANGDIVTESDMPESAQLAATMVLDGPMFSQTGQPTDVTQTAAFKRWFGDSKVVDADGKPLMVYHGTRGDFSEFDPLRTGTASDAGWYGSGFYFTPDPTTASTYAANRDSDGFGFERMREGSDNAGANVIPAYVSLQNPYDWRSENTRGLYQNSPEASVRKRAELEALGHDGVLVFRDIIQIPDGGRLSDEQWAALSAASPTVNDLGRDAVTDLFKAREWTYRELEQAYGVDVAQAMLASRSRRILMEVVAFRPEQIKSAIGNQGTFDPNSPNIMFSRSSATGPRSQSTEQTLNAFGQTTDKARQMYNRLRESGFQGVRAATLKTVVKWADRHHLVEMYDKLFNGALRRHATTYDNQEVVASRFNQMFNDPYRRLEAMQSGDRKQFETISTLMRATELEIDPRKTWEQHEHLHKLEGRKLAEAKRYVAEFRQMYGRLTPEAKAVYSDLVTMNETMFVADMVVSLQNAVRAQVPQDVMPAVFREDVTELFRNDPNTHTTLGQAKKYWDGRLEQYRTALDAYLAAKKQAVATPNEDPKSAEFDAAVKLALKGVADPKMRAQIRAMLRTAYSQPRTAAERAAIKDIAPLEAHLTMIQKGLTRIGQSPYFHMGRFGDYFVGFRTKVQADGTADEAAMARVSQVLQDKFPDVVIRSDAMDPNVVARFESHAQADEFRKAVQQLGKEGHLFFDEKEGADKIVFGKRSEVIDKFGQMGPQWLAHITENIGLDNFEDDVAQKVKNSLFQVYIDSLPNTSATKAMIHRKGRPGFNADMVRSYAHRMRMSSTRLAGLAVASDRQDAMRQMRETISSEGRSPTGDLDQFERMQTIVDEMDRREQTPIDNTSTQTYSILRALGHTFYLGMSPAYVLTQMTQLGALTWPELTKKYGSRDSFNAMVKATPIAFKIVTAAVKEGYRAAGIKGGADMIVSTDVLKKAGVSSEIQQYLTEVMGTGKLDIGNASRELARIAEGEVTGEKSAKFDEIIRLATATSYGSELLTRLVTSLAVRQLALAKGADNAAVLNQAVSALDESMLNYNYNNIGRMAGRQGIFGPVTPVVFQFHQYQFQLLGKLYREIYRAVGERPGVTKEQSAEARKFLKSHASAMVLLAGTTGLPFLTAALAALDQLCGAFSDQPCDSRTSMRNFTSDVVGTDIEPLISRGLLRATGGDISSRIGEQDIIPFSRFLADRRTLAEKIRDPSIAVGASGSMIAGMVEGMQKIADGDLLSGMQQMVPLAVQGPVKAYGLATRGFVDKNQNQLPITPHANEVMLQMFGIRPGQEADYAEARRAQTQRTAILDREGAVIRRNLVVAIERGDQAAMMEGVRAARDYEQANPGRSILDSIGSAVQQRARAQALSSATGLPLGANMRDINAYQATRFFQPQGVQ